MECPVTTFFLTQPVSRLAGEVPGAAQIFRASGLRLARLGNLALNEASIAAGIPPRRMSTCIASVARSTILSAPNSYRELPPYIISRYHQPHRAEIAWLLSAIAAAKKLGHVPFCLVEIICETASSMLTHMDTEEAHVFPQLAYNPTQNTRSRVEDHDQLVAKLIDWQMRVDDILDDRVVSKGATTVIAERVQTLLDQIVVHFHLEATFLYT